MQHNFAPAIWLSSMKIPGINTSKCRSIQKPTLAFIFMSLSRKIYSPSMLQNFTFQLYIFHRGYQPFKLLLFYMEGKISDFISKTPLFVSLLQRKIPRLCKTGRIELLLIDIFLSGKYQISKIDTINPTNHPTKPILTSNCVKGNFRVSLLATSRHWSECFISILYFSRGMNFAGLKKNETATPRSY